MRCDPITDPELGVTVGFVCSRGRRNKPCVGCSGPATLLCDGMAERLTFGSKPATCDAWLCVGCTTKGAGGTDLCPACVGARANAAVAP